MTRQRVHVAALFALSLVITACADVPTAPGPAGASPRPALSAVQFAPPHSVDAMFEGVAVSAPGFGGMFIQNGEPTMWLTDPASAEAARQALIPALAARGLGTSLRVLEGKYTWPQLSEWQHRRLLSVLAMDGVVFTDADESINRIRIGIENASFESAVRAAIQRLGVPIDAVVVEVTTRPVPVASLEDKVRSTVGGLRIASSAGGCTLGFNVDYGGTRTFMTNSHCTDSMFAATGHAFYQPTFNVSDHFVGNEYLDPALRNYGTFCPPGRNDCRWSDAALIQYDANTQSIPGGVARTASSDRWNGSKAIVGRFWISGKEVDFAGQTVHKMGATTGWTYGTVDQTCVHYDQSSYYLMCQGRINAGVFFGDSGSPVFRQVSGNEIKLLGILWGGHPVGTTEAEAPRFIFSPIGGLEEDFSTALSIAGPPPVSVSISGMTTIKTPGNYNWTCSASGGFGGYSYQWERSDSGGAYYWVGSGTSYGSWVDSGSGPYFDLRCTVTSGPETGSGTKRVNVLIL